MVGVLVHARYISRWVEFSFIKSIKSLGSSITWINVIESLGLKKKELIPSSSLDIFSPYVVSITYSHLLM